jgi:UDP-N-acetylglucosamine acyltransferase
MSRLANSVEIHPTALVHERAIVGEGTTVGAYSIIGPKVTLGKNNRIGPHVVIEGNTTIGDNNNIFQFASVGSAPQDLKYQGEDSQLIIGSYNKIREFVTIQPGTKGGGMLTKVGDKNLFMANCHLGHDGVVGNGNVIANCACLAGHVTVGNHVTVGGLVGIHQFVRIGDYSILSGGTMVVKDLPIFCIAQGDRARLVGINAIGLERNGFSKDDVTRLRKLYREFFGITDTIQARIDKLRPLQQDFKPGQDFLDFIATSERGVIMPDKAAKDD